MKSHKRFLVWSLIDEQSQTWLLVGEEEEWPRASSIAISCLKRGKVVDVMINEFIPLELIDGRKTTFRVQTGTKTDNNHFSAGVFLDEIDGVVVVDGKSKTLSTLEYKLLNLLSERENEIVSKKEITTELWHEDYSPQPKSDGRIEQLISRLRRKLEPDPRNPKYIINMRKRGYIFNSDGEHLTRS